MTAEVIILNTIGVAIAADSAVTLEYQSKYLTEKKIYNTTNKLFSLSKFHPVGIMVYGNATLLGLPWETIIKNYRKQLWDKEFDTLNDYVDDFLLYLRNVLTKEEQEEYFKQNFCQYLLSIKQDIINNIKNSTSDEKNITLAEIKKTVNTTIKSHIDKLKKRSTLSQFTEEMAIELLNNRTEIVDEAIKDIFEELSLSKTNRNELKQIAGLLFIKDIFPKNISGIVITGYGKTDNFPSFVELIIDGVIENFVKYKVHQKDKVTIESKAIIVPFAHKEMVCTFIEGISPRYLDMFTGILSEIFNDYPKMLLENISEVTNEERDWILKHLLNISEGIQNNITEKIEEFRRQKFISPVVKAVSVLPKDELAIMAETLVNLTSFKYKMSLDAETVGGPIDVAVISKGDGFVWIKRKHYFNADLNHQYFHNYYTNHDKNGE